MTQGPAELYFCGCNFPVTPETLYQALVDDSAWEQALGGTPRDREPASKISLNHAESGGVVDVGFEARSLSLIHI